MAKQKKSVVQRGIKAKYARAAEILAQLEKVKPLYSELDEITIFLQSTGTANFEVDGVHFTIIDNFINKNSVFKATAIRRFEIKKASE